jgi:T5SS/PEP-CTERM-associated repeat protein
MTASTWTWIGGTGFSTLAANWRLTFGSGNNSNVPQPGDVVFVPSGTIEDGLGELSGQGGLTIQAGGTVSVTAAGDGIDFGHTAATSGTIAVTGATALLTVAGGTKGMTIGDAGTGAMFVQNGGSVAAGFQAGAQSIDIGVGTTGTGAVTVSDPGSSIKATGQIDVGVSGTGSLTVQNAGTVNSGGATLAPSQGIDLGVLAGGIGSLSVSGTNSLLNNTGAFIVGDQGSGNLSIGTGGTVITTPGTVAGVAGLVIANTSSAADSEVTVAGTGSQLEVGGLLAVGEGGSGSLQLSSGGTVTAGSLDEGVASTGVGMIGLTGTGTSLTLAGSATVGDSSVNAIVNVLAGASFAADTLTIGSQTGSFGNVIVSGQGSTLNIADILNIGGAAGGTGVLTVGSGATVLAGVVNLKSGEAIINGGLLDPTVLIENRGSSTVGYGTIAANDIILEGTFQSNGSKSNQETLVVQGTVMGGGTLIVNGTTSVNTPGMLQIDTQDTIELTGAVLNAATTTFTDNLTPAGTYTVKNSAVDVVFQDGTGVLLLDDIAGFGGTITTYYAGDSIVITGGTLSALSVSNGNTLTVHDAAGTGRTDQIVFAAPIDPATLSIRNSNTIITGGNVIVNGTTLEIATGPYALTGFNAPGAPQFTTLLIDPGVSVTIDGSDVFSGVTLNDQGQILLSGSSVSGGAVTLASTAGITASGTVSGGTWSGMSQLVAGAAGAGSFLVNNAGTAASASVDLGASAGGSGDIIVTGAKSLLTNTGTFIVGDAGLGSLAINSGGTVTTSANATIANTGSASSSSLNVSGAGSNWRVAGALIVGAAGFGQLSVSQAGSVAAAALTAGAAAGGSGVISVAGTGSALNLTGVLNVGGLAPGELSILNAGEVTAASVTIGAGAGGAGNLVIGAGSTLTVTGTTTPLVVGTGTVAALLNIQGGTLVLSGSPTFGANGRLVQVGGLIDPAPTLIVAGNAFGGGAVDEASVEVLDTATSVSKAPDITGLATFLAPLVTGGSAAKPGIWNIDTNGTLVLNTNTVAATQEFTFADNTGVLEIGQQVTLDGGGTPQTIQAAAIGGFQGLIDSYVTGDQIIVDTTAAAGFLYTGGATITVNALVGGVPAGAQEGALVFTDPVAAAQAFADSTSATPSLGDQVIPPPCYAAGTLIETLDGPVAVEQLRMGDVVRTVLGGPGRIVWVGSRAVACERHPRPETVWPVRIARDAFGPGLPARDLFVSPDHALYLDGVLIPAKLLVNGTTVRQARRRHVVYHHIELARHDVVLAEGLPAETYLDTGDRAKFAGGRITMLYPDFTSRAWEMLGCAPLVLTGEGLAKARRAVMEHQPAGRRAFGS